MRRRYGFLLIFILIFSCIWFLTGCESLQRKFTRKRKTQETQEEMIIVPRDYSAHPFPNDVLYKQYFIYWKSWNQELVSSLNDYATYKKILDCVEQAIINLKKMSSYLKDEKAKELEVYIKKTEDLKNEVQETKAMLPYHYNSLRYKADRILSSVNRQFDLTKMKGFLK